VRTPVCDVLDIEFPLFAFSHCRDVVAAVSATGGFGVLGASRHTPDELAVDLQWISEHSRGKPFGLDLIFPLTYAGDDLAALTAKLPPEHVAFVRDLQHRLDIPPPADTEGAHAYSAHKLTMANARAQWEVCADSPIRMLVSALGPAPADVIRQAKQRGICIGGLVGKPSHAALHVEAGADVIVAQGTEAGGHVGQISTMVLVPQVVDAVGATPVLAAGGIATGRQVAAALALGAQGAWMGSIWLTTTESEVGPRLKQALLQAESGDAIVSRCFSGKPSRMLRTAWTDAWGAPGAPDPLPTPLQGLLVRDAMTSMLEHDMAGAATSPVGQVVGLMTQTTSVANTMMRIVEEYIEAVGRLP
jgi:NAD(P)H-dependent flavin oxidoreductase YrpB (nitropropane dioxygenase family)